ncbi:MAG: efflux RND transporter periplasmic adaptor subunit [Terriglobales bacterium]
MKAASLGVLAGALLWTAACTGGKKNDQAQAPRSAPVTVATVVQRDMPVQIHAIGNVESPTSVAVKSMVSGEITSVHFKEGQDVKKGALLFTLDRRPLEAELRRAEATLAKDIATATNARVDARRYAALAREGVIAQQQAEQMESSARADEELVQADRAAVENARAQLQYTTIYSPITGRTGNLSIQLGNVVKANDTPSLVTINQISPIYVTFTIPEQFLSEVKRYMVLHKLAVEASIPNDSRPAVGTLTFIDNAVDRQTGTIKLKATFDNADRRLWPGQFVNVTMTLTTQPNAIVVPAQAVQTGQQGTYVFVVKADNTAESRPVKVARTIAGQSVVESGVQPGDRVVTDGQLRLVPGAKVEIRNGSTSNAEASGSQGTQS